MKKRLPNSLRRFIRKEKARIRRGILDIKEQEELISKLYEKMIRKPKEVKEKSEEKEISKKKPKVKTKKEKK